MTDSTAEPVAPTYEADLVLEGGGVKGIGLVGAVLELDAAGYRFPRVAGTSAGAVTAALIAALQKAGRPLSELANLTNTLDYEDFRQEGALRKHLGVPGDVAHLVLHMGLFSGDFLVTWLGGILESLGVTTFADLRLASDDFPANERYSLVVHTSDIARGRLVRLPWDCGAYGIDADSWPIVEAVRASMSIPFFFEPIRFDAPATTFDGVAYQAGEVTWVDGGLLSNFPLDVFGDCEEGVCDGRPVIGVKLSASQAVAPEPRHSANVAQEFIDCIATMLANADRYYLTPDKQAQTIFVDCMKVKTTDFGIDATTRGQLCANGRLAARSWLQSRGPAGAATVAAATAVVDAAAATTTSPVLPAAPTAGDPTAEGPSGPPAAVVALPSPPVPAPEPPPPAA